MNPPSCTAATLRVRAAWLAVLMLAPLSLQAQQTAPSPTRFFHWFYQDAAALGQELVDPRTPLYVAGAAALLVPISNLDERINPEMQALYHREDDVAFYLDLVNEVGGPRMKLPVAALAAASLLTDDARFQDAAFTSLQAMIYAGLLSYGIKYTVGRLRPYEHQGPHHFAPFSGNTSFPSGHTVAAFAVLTPWVFYYPHPITYGLFAVGTGTALARLAHDKHWATDVLAGGTIGFLTAYWLTRRHQAQNQPLSVTPSVSPDAVGLYLRVQL